LEGGGGNNNLTIYQFNNRSRHLKIIKNCLMNERIGLEEISVKKINPDASG
jgi:hypothetical protein